MEAARQTGTGERVNESSHRRKWMLQMQQPVLPATMFDRAAFLVGAASAIWLASIIAIQGLRTPWALGAAGRRIPPVAFSADVIIHPLGQKMQLQY